MAESESAALPLGDIPNELLIRTTVKHRTGAIGWGTRIRTWEWRDQNPLPYRLAIPHPLRNRNMVREARL